MVAYLGGRGGGLSSAPGVGMTWVLGISASALPVCVQVYTDDWCTGVQVYTPLSPAVSGSVPSWLGAPYSALPEPEPRETWK